MANTFTLIQSQTLSSNAVSLDFTSIPNTYTDLVLYVSTRNVTTTEQWLSVGFNNNTSNYAMMFLWYDGGTLRGAAPTNQPPFLSSLADQNSPANTWSNGQIYIYNYASAIGKSYTGWSAQATTSSSNSYWGFSGSKWANTAAISTINITTRQAPSVAISSGSTFYLYGIKNT
jgi:hypothetical protein